MIINKTARFDYFIQKQFHMTTHKEGRGSLASDAII
jgi:hypothetical protein